MKHSKLATCIHHPAETMQGCHHTVSDLLRYIKWYYETRMARLEG